MNTKNNQRFKETEIKMEAAMLELMKKYEFNKITVKKICEKAQVNRSTFYAHFIDIFDMLDKMETHLRKELLSNYNKDIPKEIVLDESAFIPFLQHVKKHQYFYRISLKTRSEFPLKQGYEPMWNLIIKPFCQKADITSENEMMYYFIYFQAGFTMTVKHWVDTGCKESEFELSQIIINCIPSIWKYS